MRNRDARQRLCAELAPSLCKGSALHVNSRNSALHVNRDTRQHLCAESAICTLIFNNQIMYAHTLFCHTLICVFCVYYLKYTSLFYT